MEFPCFSAFYVLSVVLESGITSHALPQKLGVQAKGCKVSASGVFALLKQLVDSGSTGFGIDKLNSDGTGKWSVFHSW